eukprot:CAMPEP_0198298456 /NCGR_PEP_ID=MMETSP1449-20131203/40889_1 /TAXON_ID=420275 /ORGANISM="Attheya septentrionalis, Strain CCMP2084" /LENGTH=364 /DNA_ID=CAMNT_0043999715 /DNA_START=305 /DNA_END=1399 /DNA_ORIENTATION=-
MEDDDSSSSSEASLVAQYTVEHFRYGRSISVELNCATTTKGRNLIADNRDSTGLMIWPASHLMCRHLVLSSSLLLHEPSHTKRRPRRILELGCGVGLVGLVATLSEQQYRKQQPQQQQHENDSRFLMVSTDADSHVVNLCAENVDRNHTNVDGRNETVQMWSRRLWWGDSNQLDLIRTEAASNLGELSLSSVEDMDDWTFDQVFAADVVYPSTSGDALTSLFETVDRALYGPTNTPPSDPDETREKKCFLLSFIASRDGYRTPMKLLDAATRANYQIDWVPVSDNDNVTDNHESYECMGAKLLRLTRGDQDAVQHHNASLGTDECLVFPGLKRAVEASLLEDSSDEEWDAPPLSSSEDEEETMD